MLKNGIFFKNWLCKNGEKSRFIENNPSFIERI